MGLPCALRTYIAAPKTQPGLSELTLGIIPSLGGKLQLSFDFV